MSIKFFEISVPVLVRDTDREPVGVRSDVDRRRMLTVRIAMGANATEQDAVNELARMIESTLKTIDIGGDE